MSSAECDEHDACDQRPLLADEGQPSVVDPESVPVQRSDTHAAAPTTHPLPRLSLRSNANSLFVHLLTAAKVACVKSRDMHWALVAHKDQKDINLSSLRMLLVADGSNPCNVPLRLLHQH